MCEGVEVIFFRNVKQHGSPNKLYVLFSLLATANSHCS